MIDALRSALADDPRIAYALLFGSMARETGHVHSDIDVAVGSVDGKGLTPFALGELTSRLETATGRPVQVVVLDDAPPGLAYRIFRDGMPIVAPDPRALKARLARAILEYLDFKPIEDLFTHGVLRARHGR